MDIRLIEDSINGNKESFNSLIKLVRKQLYTYIYKMTHNRDASDDIFQETVLKVWKNISKFDNNKSFSTWIYCIAHNTTLDYLRQIKNKKTTDLDENVYNPRTNSVKPDYLDISAIIEKIISSLPENQKNVFVLRQINGLQFKEISEITNLPLNTVLSNMNYAVKKIRKELVENYGYEKY